MVFQMFNPEDALRDLRMMETDCVERIKALTEERQAARRLLMEIRKQIRELERDN